MNNYFTRFKYSVIDFAIIVIILLISFNLIR